MTYEWDSYKAQDNLPKHGVSFADAALALEDDFALTMEDKDSDEIRHATIGTDPHGRALVVVFTWRAERTRLISARRANAKERSQYLERARPR